MPTKQRLLARHGKAGRANHAIISRELRVKRIIEEKESWIGEAQTGTGTYKDTLLEVRCPVDVEIYDRNDDLLATVSDGDEAKIVDDIITWTEEDAKFLLIPWYSQDYQIKFVGTGNGTMSYIVNTIDAVTGERNTAKTFSNVAITPNKLITSQIGGDIETPDVRLFVLDADGKQIKEIATDGTETPVTGSNGPSGVGDGKFAPDAEITRQDLAAVITRYADFAGRQFPVTLQYAAFADETEIAEYAKNAVRTLYCDGIVGGKPNNFFDPKGGATRAEVAAILHRFIEAVK